MEMECCLMGILNFAKWPVCLPIFGEGRCGLLICCSVGSVLEDSGYSKLWALGLVGHGAQAKAVQTATSGLHLRRPVLKTRRAL